MEDLFLGLDVAQTNMGITLLTRDLKPLVLTDSGLFAKETKGLDIPDFLKNNYQFEFLEQHIGPYVDSIKMVILEGPNYNSQANLQQISIGSIHGVMQQWCFIHKLNFGVLTPKSINYAHFGTAKDITKRDTMNKMKEDLKDWLSKPEFKEFKIKNSNIGDSCAMAQIAIWFYDVLQNPSYDLTSCQKEILTTRRKYKGKEKGLAHRMNDKFMYFGSDIETIKENISKL